MPSASDNSRTRAETFSAITRLKQIAQQSQDALLTEGPVNPDHALLDLCADALHHLGGAQKAWDARRECNWINAPNREAAAAAMARDEQLCADYQAGEALGTPYLRRIAKLKATTAAGVYAKAMVVRASKTGAAGLARSLAEDLIACPGLREHLWPAGSEVRHDHA